VHLDLKGFYSVRFDIDRMRQNNAMEYTAFWNRVVVCACISMFSKINIKFLRFITSDQLYEHIMSF